MLFKRHVLRIALSILFAVHAADTWPQNLSTQQSVETARLSFSSSLASAPLPDAPSARTVPSSKPTKKVSYDDGGYAGALRGHVTCGGGLDLMQGSSKGSVLLCGVGFTFIPYITTEIGGMRLQDGSAHFYVGEDFVAPITPLIKRLRGDPIGIIGYTKVVGNSNRFDYGLGWEYHTGPEQSLGFEVRDYLQFSDPVQHAVVLRLTLVGGGPDY